MSLRHRLHSISSKFGNISKNMQALRRQKVESAILERMGFLAGTPGAGHHRKDLTSEKVKFFPVYSYLIVCRPETKPLQIAAILHGRRNLEETLNGHL